MARDISCPVWCAVVVAEREPHELRVDRVPHVELDSERLLARDQPPADHRRRLDTPIRSTIPISSGTSVLSLSSIALTTLAGQGTGTRASPPARRSRARRDAHSVTLYGRRNPSRRQKVVRYACPLRLAHGPSVRKHSAVLPLESVPNFSEGRDRSTIDAIGAALGCSRAAARRPHRPRPQPLGVHPRRRRRRARRGARRRDRCRARADRPAPPRGRAPADRRRRRRPDRPDRARRDGTRAGGRADPRRPGSASSGCPCSSTTPPDRGPAFYRRGGLDELQRRIDAGELAPDFGPSRLDPAAGGVIVGARQPLIAFNVNLRGPLEAAREIAAVVREAGGGFPGVRALGLELPSAGLVQVSMNIEDWQAVTAARGRRPGSGRRRAGAGWRWSDRARRAHSGRGGGRSRRRSLTRARAAPGRLGEATSARCR